MPLTATKVTNHGREVWRVNIPATKTGRRRRVFGATKEAALAAAAEILEEHQEFGGKLSSISAEARAFILRWSDRYSIGQLEAAVQEMHERQGQQISVAEAVARYLKAHASAGVRHRSDLRSRLGRFEQVFGERPLISVRAGELDDFLRERGGSGPNYFRVLRALFNHAVLHEWVPTNPLLRIASPQGAPREKLIFTPEEMRACLRYAAEHSRPLLRMLVLAGFCGLRHSEVMRLPVSDIDLAAGELYVGKMKTEKRGMRERWVTLLPVARAWLERAELPAEGAAVGASDITLRRHRREMMEQLQLPQWPHNVLRRCFGSYHLAAFENGNLTAAQMGHTDPETTYAKYRKVRKKADGEAWFALLPEQSTA
jgi:integrase